MAQRREPTSVLREFLSSEAAGGILLMGAADPALADEVKIGVFGGSLLSAMAGYLLLRFAPRADRTRSRSAG